MTISESDIRSLVSNTSYSPLSIPKLEEYLLACCKGEVNYIFDAIRTLIKLYQLFPVPSSPSDNNSSISNPNAVAAKAIRYTNIGYACLLAMCEYPNTTDLLALSYMIPQIITLKEPCCTVYKCADQLKSCHFDEFWKLYQNSLLNSTDPIARNVANRLIRRMQESILVVLALSYKVAPLRIVQKAIGADVVEYHDVIHKPSKDSVVESVQDQNVIFKASLDNTKRQRVYQEGVSFGTVSTLLQKIAQ
jgi:hypothetical protein